MGKPPGPPGLKSYAAVAPLFEGTTRAGGGRRWEYGQCEEFGLYVVKNVKGGDTYDLARYFRLVSASAWFGATLIGAIVGTESGTVVTAPSGLANSGAFVFASGVAR